MSPGSTTNAFPFTSSTSRLSPAPPSSGLTKQLRQKSKSLQPCLCTFQGCGKTFSKRSNLKAHLRVHTGALPYPCEFDGCEKRFRWKSSLKPHVKIHIKSGDLPRKDCSAFVYGLIATISKEILPSTSPPESLPKSKTFVKSNNFPSALPPRTSIVSTKSEQTVLYPDIVSSNSSTSAVGTHETSPSFSTDLHRGAERKHELQHRLSPSSVADTHAFDIPLSAQEYAHAISEDCIHSFSKPFDEKSSVLPAVLHEIPPFLPPAIFHSYENTPHCARVLFPTNDSTDNSESASSQDLPVFQPMENVSNILSNPGKSATPPQEINLHCKSALSSTQCSSHSEMLSLSFDFIPEVMGCQIETPLWKSSPSLFDSLQGPFTDFSNIDLLPHN